MVHGLSISYLKASMVCRPWKVSLVGLGELSEMELPPGFGRESLE